MNALLVTRYILGFAVWLAMASAFADATSTEIEFWQSVKDSGDVEMLRSYLQEFPDGEFKALAKIKIKKLTGVSDIEYLWCATKSAVTKQTKESCNQLGGKSFGNKESALNEKKRLNASKSTQNTALPKTNWCGKSAGAYQLSAQECVSGHGVPMRTKSNAEWVSRQYFGEYETHKAFAISERSIGLAAYRVNSVVAKQEALFACNMRAVKATTCRVINVDGVQADYANFRQSSKAVFSSSGKLEELTGHYRLTVRDSDGLMGDLFIEVNGDKIGGSIRLCGEGSHQCANFQINEIFEKGRGRFFRSGLLLKTNPGGRWPEGWQLGLSLSSDTSILIGDVGPYIFDGERYSD